MQPFRFRILAFLLGTIFLFTLVGCDSGGGGMDNSPPRLSTVPQNSTIEVDSTYQTQVEATDPDGDELTYSLIEPPNGVSIDVTSGQIRWTPTLDQADSTYTFDLSVSDGEARVDTSFALTVIVSEDPAQVTLDPMTTHQEMLGFGGAVTWMCERITLNSNTDEITQLLFDDLGSDIVRFKTWYYPTGYPDDKSPDEMTVDGYADAFEATNQLYDLAKQHNEDIDVLLSSWGPPAPLKSNGSIYAGTLKRNDNGEFVYGAFAEYWEDILTHITFKPEYISIQNEPDFVTEDWETSEWRPTETSSYPGYETAIDSVYERIRVQNNPPAFIGPETATTGAMESYVSVLQDKEFVERYGYHLYDFSADTPIEETVTPLQNLSNFATGKPNIMTEYSRMGWFRTARLINTVVVEANASGYIYWKGTWSGDNAMITVDFDGNYEVQPFYYVLKHFAKHVNEGYDRIEVSTSTDRLDVSGYKNPAGDKLTLILINPISVQREVSIDVASGASIQNMSVFQSQSGSFYEDRSAEATADALTLPPSSITTVSIEL